MGDWRVEDYVYDCTHVTAKPEGARLPAETWERIEPLRPALAPVRGGGAARYPTAVKAAWNDTHLFFFFHAEDQDIWWTLTEHDSPIYNEEVVEVFINTEGQGKEPYYELEVSPGNVTWDSVINDVKDIVPKRDGPAYECGGLRTEVEIKGKPNDPGVKDEYWEAHFAIPFASLPGSPTPPQPGYEFRVNVFRIERPRNAEPEAQAWSHPGGGRFHNPARFGILRFVK